ncbi:hypothetical protein E2C01_039522 [Portunus trituberculatus]|uniref:CCHC-type domain-containing protein n=1 Tax=Portunus trituberculatus TaxID=210409 RepID=A0A5B7FK18_PORTR|nr:hypothetical protein [Portunus trituberculatus]
MLRDRLAGEITRVDEMVQNIFDGPPIKWEDVQGLTKFLSNLWDCIVQMKNTGRLQEIEAFTSVSQIAKRFIGRLREHYDDRFFKYEKKTGNRPNIMWLKDFVAETVRRIKKGGRCENRTSRRTIGLVTTEWDTDGGLGRVSKRPACPICPSHEIHPLSACHRFHRMDVSERINTVRRANLCYNCLGRNHNVKDCFKEAQCCINGCRQKHSTWLHKHVWQSPRSDQRVRGVSNYRYTRPTELMPVQHKALSLERRSADRQETASPPTTREHTVKPEVNEPSTSCNSEKGKMDEQRPAQ